jgi:acetoin:2,6-dichlorophenolindophenol oxidoreductase subunit beta
MHSKDLQTEELTFSEAINSGLTLAMEQDPHMICYGLGISDPKAIFGTTAGLENKFGPTRVFDMPTSENALTGVSIGAAIGGVRSVVTHQRLDFFLLAMDQLVNSAAKWHYTYGVSVPITIRLIIGRGWGQGPTHSQNLQAWFAHIPGLRVVSPTSPSDAKGLLLSSIFDPNPVVFLEHRWLHNASGPVVKGDHRVPIGKANLIKEGTALTVVSMSYLTVEARIAVEYLARFNIYCELIDLRTIKPIDWDTLDASIIKTGRLLALDTGYSTGSVAGEIIATAVIKHFDYFKCSPRRLAMPDVPEPSSFGLTKDFFVDAEKSYLRFFPCCLSTSQKFLKKFRGLNHPMMCRGMV